MRDPIRQNPTADAGRSPSVAATDRADQRLVFNGIDGRTGDYAFRPMMPRELARRARGQRVDGDHVQEMRVRNLQHKEPTRAMVDGRDPTRISEAGWGIVFPQKIDERIRQALEPLLEVRRGQTELFREFSGDDGYRTGELKISFLSRHRAGPGSVDPAAVPFYLLLVGGPDVMPFSFQHQLGAQYAVGRLHFDTIEEYAQYAASIVAAETAAGTAAGAVSDKRRRAVFFGPSNPGDANTELSRNQLVEPLASRLRERAGPAWEVETAVGEDATKARLHRLLAGADRPDLLFTASHGLLLSSSNPRQLERQGALITQDWPRPTGRRLDSGCYLAAPDLDAEARLEPLISFHFACFSAGTPRWDDLDHLPVAERRRYAEEAFVARLPQRLLAHEQGGALAVVGHVDQSFSYSFLWDREPQLQTFEDCLLRLLRGHPVGWAMEPFGRRYAELVSDLFDLERQQELQPMLEPDPLLYADLWTATQDARGYVVLGDPAVRLPSRRGGELGDE